MTIMPNSAYWPGEQNKLDFGNTLFAGGVGKIPPAFLTA